MKSAFVQLKKDLYQNEYGCKIPGISDYKTLVNKVFITLLVFFSLFFSQNINAQTRACWGTSCSAGNITLHKIFLASDLLGMPLTTSSCSSTWSHCKCLPGYHN